ncbi:MAG: hypothetical protein C0P61_006795 [Bacillota bacterium]|nr:hypothetical protein [Bacillota bacterium]REJ37285.1 MAG: hypothetical protein DIU82_01170 [Bacillota bacterium]
MDVLENLFPGIWGELVLVIIGVGAFMTGLTGLLLGGRRLPPFEIPARLRGFANLAFALLTMVGLTLITNTRPDFVERLFNTLTQ